MASIRGTILPFETLQEALNTYRADDLKQLAKLVTSQPPSRKGECAEAIAKALEGDALRRRYEALDSLSQAALAETVHENFGEFDSATFKAKYGALPVRRWVDPLNFLKKHPYTLLDILLPNDLMPDDIRERLSEFVPPPAEASVETVAELPEVVHRQLPRWYRGDDLNDEQKLTVVETERAALHDLVAVLRLVEAGKVSVSKTTKRVTTASAAKVLEVLRDGDFVPLEALEKAADTMRPYAWPLILQAAGLARLSGSKLALTRAGKAALGKPPHEVIKSAWDRWLGNKLLDEFNRIEHIKGQQKKGRGGLTAAGPRRSAVAEMLARCPAGAWIEIDEFFRFCQASGIEFDVSQNTWNLYIGEPQYGSLGYAGCHDWSIIEGRYVMCVLWEYAATLGLIDIAHVPAAYARDDFGSLWGTDDLDALSRYDGLKYFRVNALGAYCSDMTDTYEAPAIASRPALKVLPNRDIVVRDPEHFQAGDALFLDKICRKANEATWRLSQSRILAAIEAGLAQSEITEFLSAKNDGDLPDNIAHFLDDIAQRAAQVQHAGSAEVFEAADEHTALLILHDATLKNLCFPAEQNRLIVPAENLTAFRRALRKLGYAAPFKQPGV